MNELAGKRAGSFFFYLRLIKLIYGNRLGATEKAESVFKTD